LNMIAAPLRQLLLTGLCFFAALGVGRAAPADAARRTVQTTNAATLFPLMDSGPTCLAPTLGWPPLDWRWDGRAPIPRPAKVA
jgi:hypothetical protein